MMTDMICHAQDKKWVIVVLPVLLVLLCCGLGLWAVFASARSEARTKWVQLWQSKVARMLTS